MKADVKSGEVPRIVYLVFLPLYLLIRFLFSCLLVVWAFWLKPFPAALEKFAIRVVATENNGTWDDHIKVYTALRLLDRYDKEKLELVRKHIRIIFLGAMKANGCYYMGTGVCALNLEKPPVEMSPGQLVVSIIGGLVHEASKIKFAGNFGAYLRISEEVKELCEEEQRRTMQKFYDELT